MIILFISTLLAIFARKKRTRKIAWIVTGVVLGFMLMAAVGNSAPGDTAGAKRFGVIAGGWLWFTAIAVIAKFLGGMVLRKLRVMRERRKTAPDNPPPLPGTPTPEPQPASVKRDYTWPLVAVAAAILIAAAIIYAASQHHPAPPVTTPPPTVSASATPVPTPSQASPAPVVRSTPDLDPSHLLAPPASPAPAPKPREAISLVVLAEKISPSVVVLTAYNSDGEALKTATGFFVGNAGNIATNWHVISGAARVTAKTSTGELLEVASVLLYDVALDVAMISLGATGRAFPGIADVYRKAPPRMGSSVIVLGNPEGFEQSLSQGIVSAIRHDKAGTLIQITAPISKGSSGSPVMDSTGAIIGIATEVAREGQSLNFARSLADFVALGDKGRNERTFSEIIVERNNALTNSGLLENYRRAQKANDMRGKAQCALAIREAFPDDAGSYAFTGETFVELHDYEHAITEYEQARLLFPEFPDTWERLGELYQETGQTQDAQRCFSRAKQLREKGIIKPTPSAQTSLETPAVPNAPTVSCRIVGLRAGDKLNVRSGPGVNYSTVASYSATQSRSIRLRDGEGEQVTNGGDTWRKVYSAATGGNLGWANSKYVKIGR